MSNRTLNEPSPKKFKVGDTVGFYSARNRVPERPIPVEVTSVNDLEIKVVTAAGREITFVARELDGKHVTKETADSQQPDTIVHHEFNFPKPPLSDTLLPLAIIASLPFRAIIYVIDRIKYRKHQKVDAYLGKVAEFNETAQPFVVGESVLIMTRKGSPLVKMKYPFRQAKVIKVENDEVTVSYRETYGGNLVGYPSKTFKLQPDPNPNKLYVSEPITEDSTVFPDFILHRPPMRLGEFWTLSSN